MNFDKKASTKQPDKSYRYRDSGRVTREVVEAIQGGDHAAFEIMYLSYYNIIEEFLERLTGSPDTASDIAQEIFATVWVRRSAIDPDRSIMSYLFKAARNEAYKSFRHTNKFDDLPEDYEDNSALMTSTPDEVYIAKETELLIKIAVSNMPEQRRAVYEMYEQGLSYEEIAAKIGITQENARKHLSLARKDLEILRLIIVAMLTIH